jgi:hypothetical protein
VTLYTRVLSGVEEVGHIGSVEREMNSDMAWLTLAVVRASATAIRVV